MKRRPSHRSKNHQTFTCCALSLSLRYRRTKHVHPTLALASRGAMLSLKEAVGIGHESMHLRVPFSWLLPRARLRWS